MPEPSKATKGIARRVRTAVANMSRSWDPTLQNTAQRIKDGDVKIAFVGDLKPLPNAEALLKASGKPPAEIAATLQTHYLADIPGGNPVLLSKTGRIRAFERNGVVYIPSDADDAPSPTDPLGQRLSTDIVHEVNHTLNPVRANEGTDPDGFMWETFIAEVRATYVADRLPDGQSDKGYTSLRLERAVEHAKEQAGIRGWTTHPGWRADFETLAKTWIPDGNLDNRK